MRVKYVGIESVVINGLTYEHDQEYDWNDNLPLATGFVRVPKDFNAPTNEPKLPVENTPGRTLNVPDKQRVDPFSADPSAFRPTSKPEAVLDKKALAAEKREAAKAANEKGE